MDEKSMRDATREAVRAKFGRKRYLKAKVKPRYPAGVERDYIRTVDGLMALLNKVVKEHMPEIEKAARREAEPLARFDDVQDFAQAIQAAFEEMHQDLLDEIEMYDLRARLKKLAARGQAMSVREWKRTLKKTLGVDVTEDYFRGGYFAEMIERWVDENVGLIKTIPSDTLAEMQNIIRRGYRNGVHSEDLIEEITSTYNVSKRHARFIARDQTAKLNADISEQQQRDAGVEKYEWSTSGDSRVRESHEKLDGKTFSWDDPPVVDEKTGRRCHPGQDYQCRCVALAVFDIETLSLPIASA